MQGTLSPHDGNISKSGRFLEIVQSDRKRQRWYVFIAIWSNAVCICSTLRAPRLHQTRAASVLTPYEKKSNCCSVRTRVRSFIWSLCRLLFQTLAAQMCVSVLLLSRNSEGFQLQRVKYLTRLIYQIKSSRDTFVICCWLNLDYYFLWMSIKRDTAVLQVYNLLNCDFWGG